jgi:hypothetical protein
MKGINLAFQPLLQDSKDLPLSFSRSAANALRIPEIKRGNSYLNRGSLNSFQISVS